MFLKINLDYLWCLCVQRILSKHLPVALQTSPCSTCILCTWCNAQQSSTDIRFFLFFSESVMDLVNTVFLCWSVEYTLLNEVILLELIYYCSVFCITGAPKKQILRFLLCKVIPKHAPGDISHLSIHIYLQAIEEIKFTWK